ncbi:hypothetical protein QAD02_022695 [Eretmocerus hayati]|uniref:Uncharacterized protein n=1 Tax=Eretmocerus hayati TaxID=131215 RepID=A0ACC2PTP9_9HYME|nr:hypothetical protein QAD02_022695 [Eretmocerus hayati]
MEDSYAVHRRRKAAAARRREKTPDPTIQLAGLGFGDDNDDDAKQQCEAANRVMDEEGERRARMERMVEDTERMEAEERARSKSRQLETEEPPAVNIRAKSPSINRRERTPQEPDNRVREKAESPLNVKDEIDEGPGRDLRRRLGSPEAAKMRPTRHLSPSMTDPNGDSDPRRSRMSSRSRQSNQSEEDEYMMSMRQRSQVRRSPSQLVKKQIIPLSNESLYGDVAKAKRAYAHRQPSDDYEYEEDEEEEREEFIPRKRRETTVRKRKSSIIHTETEKEEINKVTFREVFSSIWHITMEFKEFCHQNPQEVQTLIELRNLCIVETIITLIVCGLGGLAFRFTEGSFESLYKCGVKRVKRDFLDSLWTYSHNMKEDDWKSMARRKLMDFEEQLHAAHEAGMQTYSGQRNWTFLNAVVYSLTIISTIGYGHISPSTTTGRALTIVYAIIGIPLFLIVLADFGKLFTRGIKFLWAFVRRVYYTGSCRKVRRTVQVQEMMKGVQLVYDFAKMRRPSEMSPDELAEIQRQQQQHQQTVLSLDGNASQQTESPSTPAMSTFEIDDEFNLPISVAIAILIVYIFVGATVFNIFEDWTFFESFYFVFISMSTIGFGDFVPKDPLYMMLSIVYMIFGLALTSMCINVVQVMLADQFKQASQKIGASIGLHVSEEDGSLKPDAPPEPIEIADIHATIKTSQTDIGEKLAPTVKHEEAEL